VSGTTTLDRVLGLTAIPDLAHLHPGDLASLAERTEERWAEPDTPCTPEDDEGEVCLLLEGSLTIAATATVVHAPALVAATETLAGIVLPTRAGPEGARIITLRRDVLEWVMADVYEIWIAMLRHVAARWFAAAPRTVEPARIARPGFVDDPASLVTRIVLLSESDLFGELRAITVGRLASAMAEHSLDRDEPLWEEGDASDECYVVLEGGFSRGTGSDREALPSGPGAVFGMREMFAGVTRSGCVAANESSRVLRLSYEAVLDEFEDDPDDAATLLQALARRTLRDEAEREEMER
jgi:hypothetical protein